MRPTPLRCITHNPPSTPRPLYVGRPPADVCPLHDYRGAGFDPVPCPPLESPDYFHWVVL